MSFALFVWAVVVLLFWIGLLFDLPRRWPRRLMLRLRSEGADATSDDAPCDDVAVAIPARDEADVLDRSLGSLLAQGDDFVHLVLVDDRSSDGTADVARRLIKEEAPRGRAEVIEGTPTPEGWSGKTWALQRAVECILEGPEAKRVRWILFTDADIGHPSGSIRALRRLAQEEKRDLVSVMVRLRTATFWERLLIPVFVWFFQLMFPFRRVRKDRSRVAAAAGGCVLLSREKLEAIGGLDSIRDAVIDDVSLAKKVKAKGGGLWLGLSTTMVSIRSYSGLGQILGMVSRTAFDQLRYSYVLLVLTLLALLAFFVAPPCLAIVAALTDDPLTGLAASLAWGIQTWLLLPAVRHHGVAPRYALLLPIASIFYMWMTALSAWNHFRGRGPRWKGREIGRGSQ